MILCYILLLIMTMIGSTASLFLKRASERMEGFFTLLRNKNLYIGGAMYLVAAVLNIIVLRYLDYSVVLPLTSITYIWTMFLSFFLLKEKINKKKLIGVGLIVVGAMLIAG